jgi:hypothetical protein
MGYDHLVGLFKFLVWGVVGGAAFIIFLKATTGRINLRGLLGNSSDGTGTTASRVQLLFMTLVGAFGYFGLAANSLANCGGGSTGCSLPSPPTELLALLGGSHAFYLGAKGLNVGDLIARMRGNGQQGGSP